MMLSHKTFRLLIPLLIFSGLQQAFVFSDFNQVRRSISEMLRHSYIHSSFKQFETIRGAEYLDASFGSKMLYLFKKQRNLVPSCFTLPS